MFYRGFRSQIQHLPHCFELFPVRVCKSTGIFETGWGSSMQRGVATKRARTPRGKDNREIKELAELHRRVALRAFQLFETRGRIHGRDLEDWFRAEKEILSGQQDIESG